MNDYKAKWLPHFNRMDINKLQNLHCIARYVQNMAMNIKTELDLVLRKCKLLTIYYEVFWNVDTGKPHI